MTAYVFDIEADGLNPSVIFCIVALETETGRMHSFGPDKIKEGIELLNSAGKLIGHNILGYDMPVIKKLHGVDLAVDKKIVDGKIYHVAGTGEPGYGGDLGLAAEAQIYLDVSGVYIDRATDELYFCDTGNNRIRKIGLSGSDDPDFFITTLIVFILKLIK